MKSKLSINDVILEAGVGDGRLISFLAPSVKRFIGIDNSDLMIKKSKKIADKYPNAQIIKLELEDLKTIYSGIYFDFSLCLWNTLGNIKNEVNVLKEIAKITKKSILLTLYYKSTLNDRKEWYDSADVEILKIDKIKEIFYLKNGIKSKSYSLVDVEKIAKQARLQIKTFKILGGVMLFVELEHISNIKIENNLK